MNATPSLPETRPLAVMQDLINRHGRLPVLALALLALLRPAPRPRPASDDVLTDHLRRDIGIAPRAAPQRGWEHYR